MNVGAAHWLKRVFGISVLVLVPTLLGCGSPKRDFIDTSVDAAHDSGSPGRDSSTGSDSQRDTSTASDASTTDMSTGTDARLDVAQGDGRDATSDLRRDGSDASSEPGIDAPVDINVPDIVVDVDNNPPTIVDTIPANNAMAVAVGTTITVEFSKPMNPASTGLTLQPTAPLGAAVWNPAYTSVAFTPPSPLVATTSYIATVAGSDAGGRALTGATTFAFTTGAGADTTPPTIRGTVPANNAVAVPSGTNIVVTFTEPMDVGSVVVTPVPDIMLGMPTFNSQNTEVSFTPTTPLLPYTEYTLTVAGRDPAMNPLGPPTTFKFTTAQPPDTTPPTVVSVNPADGAMNVPSNSSIVITFSEAMNITATSAAVSISPMVTCLGGWSWNQTMTTTTCVPSTPLPYMTLHTVGVGVGAQDAAGNALAAAFSSTFITGVMPDTTPPTIVAVTPGNSTSGAARNAKIIVDFSEAMDVNSAQSAFAVTFPAGITGTFAWANGNTQMVFTPTVLYPYGAAVRWQVSSAARDAAGNAKTTDDAYSFNVIQSTTTNFACIPALDGFVNSIPTAYPAGSIVLGASTYTLRGFAGFDITGLPATTTIITSATIYLRQYDVAGTPYGPTRLGDVLWRHVDYGPTLDSGDYNTPVLAHTSNQGVLSTNATFEVKSSIVTLSVRDDFTNRAARGNRSEFMIRFTYDTTTPITADYAYFYPCENAAVANRPYLSVTYEHP